MKHPLRSARVSLTFENTPGQEYRVDLDGLRRGFVAKAPVTEGGWWWRCTAGPHKGAFGHAQTKSEAVCLVVTDKSSRCVLISGSVQP